MLVLLGARRAVRVKVTILVYRYDVEDVEDHSSDIEAQQPQESRAYLLTVMEPSVCPGVCSWSKLELNL